MIAARPEETTRRRDLVAVLAEAFGVTGVSGLRRVASETGETVLVDGVRGPSHVVKVVEPAELADARRQLALLVHVARRDPGSPVPKVVPAAGGGHLAPLDGGRAAWVVTFLPGRALEDVPLTPAVVAAVARTVRRVQRALAGFDAEPVPARHDWALDAIVEHEPLVDDVLEPERRSRARAVIGAFRDARDDRAALPSQVLHADANLSNLLVEGERVTGLIDFGDAVHAPRVDDTAIALAYLGMHDPVRRDRTTAEYLVAAGDGALTGAERQHLPLLVAVRTLMVLLAGRDIARRAVARGLPERGTYALRYDALAAASFDALPLP